MTSGEGSEPKKGFTPPQNVCEFCCVDLLVEGERGDTVMRQLVEKKGDNLRKVRGRMCVLPLLSTVRKGSESSQGGKQRRNPCGASARLSPANALLNLI